jgi:hypothetical protein
MAAVSAVGWAADSARAPRVRSAPPRLTLGVPRLGLPPSVPSRGLRSAAVWWLPMGCAPPAPIMFASVASLAQAEPADEVAASGDGAPRRGMPPISWPGRSLTGPPG